MSELDNEENIKNTIQDTQMLIRNHMQQHKKISKQLHGQIKKDKKTIELFKEKIAKLILEKKKLEDKQHSKSDNEQFDTPQLQLLKQQIMQEMNEKKEYDDKIAEIQNDFLVIKSEMGGLNATQALKERYEKHIRILENRLDKANQKFNDAIEYDKNLRNEIDKLRKERFFFENIYKKLEKELEKLRKDISKNLEEAYDNYEQRDIKQEGFENLKSQMIKKETEYTNMLSGIANDMNVRNTRKKSQERKDMKAFKMEEDNSITAKKYSRKLKSEQYEKMEEFLNDKFQNLKYKFEKLKEFTGQKNVSELCDNFKANEKKNFDHFLNITLISNEAKKLESEIKELEEEIAIHRKDKNSQQGIERQGLINELRAKTDKLNEKKDEYENETKRYLERFKSTKNHIVNLFNSLKCKDELTDEEKSIFFSIRPKDHFTKEIKEEEKDVSEREGGEENVEGGEEEKIEVTENNVMIMLSLIEKKLKFNEKVLEHFLNEEQNLMEIKKESVSTRQVNDNMKMAFANMDIGKIKAMEKIKNEQHPEDFKLENLIAYSQRVADEVLDNINKANQIEKKQQNKLNKKLKP